MTDPLPIPRTYLPRKLNLRRPKKFHLRHLGAMLGTQPRTLQKVGFQHEYLSINSEVSVQYPGFRIDSDLSGVPIICKMQSESNSDVLSNISVLFVSFFITRKASRSSSSILSNSVRLNSIFNAFSIRYFSSMF